MSADSPKAMKNLDDELKRALFLLRGWHTPGEPCLCDPPATPEKKHMSWCEALDEECDCYWV